MKSALLCAAGIAACAAISLSAGSAQAGFGFEDECFDEAFYLATYPDVAAAIRAGSFASGRAHYELHGRGEKRLPCPSGGEPIFPRKRLVLLAAAVAAILYLNHSRKLGVTATALGLAVSMGVFAYFDYVTGRLVFIFTDIASDTYTQFWPMMTYLSRRIWSGELPMWSFGIGLGHNAYPAWLADPFAALGILAGERLLPYTLGPLQLLKILLAVVCLAEYFRLLGYSRTACIAGALAIGFCGHMVSRGTWYEYGTEVVAVSFYLYAFERFVQSGRIGLLAVATGLVGCGQTYYAYLYFLLLLTFALTRIFFLRDRLFAAPGPVFGRWMASSCIGVLLVAVLLLPDLLATLRSTRVSGPGEVMSEHLRASVLMTERWDVLLTAVARQLSPNLLGGANKYTGYWNYLEAPLAYVGILPLLCLVPLFVYGTKKHRIVLAAFLIAAMGYHVVVYFRLALNAFAGPLFKISNFWIALGFGICAAAALDAIERRSESSAIVLGASVPLVAGMSALVLWRAPAYGMAVDRVILAVILASALGSTLGLFSMRRRKSGESAGALILAVVVLELSLTSYQTLNVYRGPLDGHDPKSNAGYDDAALGTIRKIRAGDTSAYRIERDRNSVNLMDALMQDYHGTKAYLSLNSSSHVQFLWDLGLLDMTPGAASYIDGIGPRGAVLPLVGVKYYMASSGPAPSGYRKEFQDGKIGVFVNERSAMGFYYTQAISNRDFASLRTPVERQAALLRAAVLDSPSGPVRRLSVAELHQEILPTFSGCTDKESCLDPAGISDDLSRLSENPVRFTKFADGEVAGSVVARQPGVLFLSIPFDAGWRAFIDGRERTTRQVNVGFVGVELSPGEHEFVLVYRTPGLLLGASLTATALVALASWILVPIWRRKRLASA